MLITDIDTFIELQFNNLNDYIDKNKFNKSIKKDISAFVNYYEKFINTINYSNIVFAEKVRVIIEKYILYYLLLRICINEDLDTIENSNNEKIFVEKIFNISNSLPILDSVSIGELVEVYLMYYISISLLKKKTKNEETNIANLPKNDKTDEILQIFHDIGNENIGKFFDTSKKDSMHNILMTLLFKKVYVKSDKKEIARLIETNDFQNGEFKYITVIEARIKEIDFASLEILFDIESRKLGLPEDYYKLIDDYKIITLGDIEENLNPDFAIQSNLLSDDRKIAYLFHKKILIPITDEILRYNITAEKYANDNQDTKKQTYKSDTKLSYIVNKINAVTEHARNPLTKKIYYQPLAYRQAVPYNDIEEMKIMKKFADIGRVNADNVIPFTELLSFRVYPYINYHDFAHYGFLHRHYYTTEALRYVNFRGKKGEGGFEHINRYMQWRSITHDMFKTNNQHDFNSAIVGVAFPKYINFLPYDIRCLKLKNSVNIRKYNTNGYKVSKTLLEKLILNNKTFNKTPFWIFDINTDKFTQDQYESITTDDPNYFKKLIAKMYDIVEQLTLNRILTMFETYAPLTLYQSNQIFQIITKKLVPIPLYSDKMAEINYARYFTYLPNRIETIDIRDVTFRTDELIKLPVYQRPKNLNITVVDINKDKLINVNILDIAVCQHNITLEDIQKIRERDPTLFTKKLNEFYKKYVVDHVNSNFICNSCGLDINIDKYISQYNDLIKINAESRVPLEEQNRYKKFAKAIASLDKIIERMGSIFNLSEYMGNHPSSIIKRRETIRTLLDILLSSQDLRSQNPSKFDSDTNQLKEISGAKYSEYFAFPVENDIFIYSSRDTDKFKRMKYNTILTHIAVIMILDMNNSSILYFNYDKLINFIIFEKYGLSTLDNLKLRFNMGNDLVYLGNYLLLSYVIYYMSSMMIRYKIYELENPEIDVKKGVPPLDRLKIMHTITHALSIIVDRRVKKPDEYLYTILANNYFIKLQTIFNSDNSKTTLKEIKYFTEKKINPTDNALVKKLTTKKHFLHEIIGKLLPYETIERELYKSIKIYLRYFPIKYSNIFAPLTNEEKNIMVKKDLLWMYKNESAQQKLNIDILKIDQYSLDELYAIKNKYIETIKKNIELQKVQLAKANYKIQKKQSKLDILYNTLLTELSPFDDILNKFLNKMEKYINESQSIFKDDFYLRKSVFIINHDENGFPIKPYKIDKITTDKNVIIYREKNVERHYDLHSLAYLGYKDSSNNFVAVKNYQFLIVKHSLMNKIKYLGLYNKYVNIVPFDKRLNYQTKFRGDVLYTNQELIKQLLETKVNHDKILIEKFQRIIFTIRNNTQKKSQVHIKTNQTKEAVDEMTKEKKLIDEFILRLPDIKIFNDEFIVFLQNWKNVCSSYKYTSDDIKLINELWIDSDNIINNNKYNIFIRYLLIQLIQLLDMNNDKTNINLCSLISMIFDLMWDEYAITNNYEINKFLLILYSGNEEITISSVGLDDTGNNEITPEEREKLSEEQKAVLVDAEDDFKEESEAIDVEGMDEDEKDLGEDNLAVMMHDAGNSDNI